MQPQSLFCPGCGLRIAAGEAEATEVDTAIIPRSEPTQQRINGEEAGKTARYEAQTDTLETKKIADKVTEQVTEPVDEKPQENFSESRIFTIYNKSAEPAQLAKKADDMLAILTSAIQDIVVVKEMMKEQGIWDDERYKELRTRRMIEDHSSGGAGPWFEYSIYPYTLDESEFLRHQFHADDEEIQKFEKEVEHIQILS